MIEMKLRSNTSKVKNKDLSHQEMERISPIIKQLAKQFQKNLEI